MERLSGCTGYKLRSTLLSQAKAFVEARHEANKTALVKRLDAEKWVQVSYIILLTILECQHSHYQSSQTLGATSALSLELRKILLVLWAVNHVFSMLVHMPHPTKL